MSANAFLMILIDLLAVSILSFGLYYPRHRRRDLVTAFFGANIGVFAIASVLGSTEVALGLGLGLFIAKTLLERSGATITMVNAVPPGKGARVTIVWPREVFEHGRADRGLFGGDQTRALMDEVA